MTPAKNSQNWLPGIFNDFFGNEWITKTNSSAPAFNIIEDDKEYKRQPDQGLPDKGSGETGKFGRAFGDQAVSESRVGIWPAEHLQYI